MVAHSLPKLPACTICSLHSAFIRSTILNDKYCVRVVKFASIRGDSILE